MRIFYICCRALELGSGLTTLPDGPKGVRGGHIPWRPRWCFSLLLPDLFPLQGYIGSVMIPHGMVVDRIERLAQDIRKAYPDSTPHFLVVLKGGAEFATDLTRALRSTHANGSASHIPYTLDYVRVKSYEGTESSGNGASEQRYEAEQLCVSASPRRHVFHVSFCDLSLQSRSPVLT
jgi:Phosphoribosyl transferase domain